MNKISNSRLESEKMKSIGRWVCQFTPAEWGLLCMNQKFIDIILDDIDEASRIARKVLKRKSIISKVELSESEKLN
jgi:hypothetical protein